MSKINLLLANANNNLTKQETMVKSAVKSAEIFAFPKLKIDWDIDVVITGRGPVSAIPEDHVGGHTFDSDFIIIRVENGATEGVVSEVLCHELCHSARWGKNDEWMNTLFDALIFEGLATYFEAEYTKNKQEKQFFIKTIINRSDKENEKILNLLKTQLFHKKYNYNLIFFAGDDNLPRWSGYSLGYYLVKKYLTNTNQKIEDVFANKYADFKRILSDCV